MEASKPSTSTYYHKICALAQSWWPSVLLRATAGRCTLINKGGFAPTYLKKTSSGRQWVCMALVPCTWSLQYETVQYRILHYSTDTRLCYDHSKQPKTMRKSNVPPYSWRSGRPWVHCNVLVLCRYALVKRLDIWILYRDS
jgi:hypothetical protein